MRASDRLRRPPRRKRFGQHFLHDPAVIERIVSAIQPAAPDRLVEIGPGRGALTRRLLAAGPQSLDVIEIDRDLAALLRQDLQDPNPGSHHPTPDLHDAAPDTRAAPNLHAARDTYAAPDPRAARNPHAAGRLAVHAADALEFDFQNLARARGGPLRIVGNLPYNISTPLLFHLLRNAPAIQDLHIMLQREVIARMAAKAGESDYGRLTVMLAPWVSVERLFDVGPGAFQPPPRVWSAVARLTVRAQPAFTVSENFAVVVAAAFAHRRKTLRNALRELVSLEQIEAAGLDPGARPETFPPEAFNALAQKLVRSDSSG